MKLYFPLSLAFGYLFILWCRTYSCKWNFLSSIEFCINWALVSIFISSMIWDNYLLFKKTVQFIFSIWMLCLQKPKRSFYDVALILASETLFFLSVCLLLSLFYKVPPYLLSISLSLFLFVISFERKHKFALIKMKRDYCSKYKDTKWRAKKHREYNHKRTNHENKG